MSAQEGEGLSLRSFILVLLFHHVINGEKYLAGEAVFYLTCQILWVFLDQ